tara:strand:+ start:25593 stop:26090 length:498 start_codon:yes stop_codon:yes gene_type:complete
MNSIDLENSLILPDVCDLMQDRLSIQLDIDPTRVKAAAHIAQTVDLARVIGKVNVERCINPSTTADETLKELVIPAWLFYTNARMLKMFNGTLTDSGYIVSEDAERGAKQASKDAEESYSVAEVYLESALDFLDAETPTASDDIDRTKLTPKIRVFGGQENRGSN